MTLETWLLFCLTEILLCATPGPGVFLVVSLSMMNGVRSGFAATMGVLAASIFYFILASTGLAVILETSSEVFFIIKYLGAAYLVWLGVNLIRISYSSNSIRNNLQSFSSSRSFWKGFITHGSNPKLLLFFTAILPQFVNPNNSFEIQVMILGVSALLIQTVILLAYSVLANQTREITGSRLQRNIQKIGGVFLIGAGVGLATVTKQ